MSVERSVVVLICNHLYRGARLFPPLYFSVGPETASVRRQLHIKEVIRTNFYMHSIRHYIF